MNLFLIIIAFTFAWLIGKAMGEVANFTDEIKEKND